MRLCAKMKTGFYLLLCLSLLFSGCQLDKEDKATYREKFTEKEKENGIAKFDLMENVMVDAKITPSEKYKDGLKKYYMVQFYETTDLKNRKDFAKNPTLYGKKLSDVMDMIADKLDVEFSPKKPKMEIDDNSAIASASAKGNHGYRADFFATWETGNPLLDNAKQLYYPYMYVSSNVGNGQTEYDLEMYLKGYKNMDIAFLSDKDKTSQELKAFLEELSGRKLCDIWDCIAVTEESVTELRKVMQQDSSRKLPELPEQEYCLYRFYYDVDGLPYQNLFLNYNLKTGETASNLAKLTSWSGSQLVGLNEDPQEIKISEDGIIDLNTSNFRMQGKVYKEAEKVTNPDNVIQKIKEYYERKLITKPVTVTEVSRVYTGYFTDGSEGEIQPTIAPFWLVRIHNGETNNTGFVYDAFSGEAIIEGGNVF